MTRFSAPVATYVALTGSGGGLLAWVIQIYLGESPRTTRLGDLAIQVLLGAGAAIIFVYLVANADRKDRTRLLALSLLSGFFWEPSWEAAGALIDEKQSEIAANKAEVALAEAEDILIETATQDPTVATDAAAEILKRVDRAEELSLEIDRPEDLRRVNAITARVIRGLAGRTPTPQDQPGFRESEATARRLYEMTSPPGGEGRTPPR